MFGSLINMPIRLTRRGVQLALQGTQAVAERAIGLVGERIMPTAPEPQADGSRDEGEGRKARDEGPEDGGQGSRNEEDGSDGGRETPVDPRSAAEPASETIAEETRQPTPRPAPAPRRSAPPAPEPEHISDEDTVVEAVSERGAEDGAGAQIRVAEPWEGYGELRAADVVDRIRGASTAELGAIELYELSHRKRQTVLDGVQRELRRAQNNP